MGLHPVDKGELFVQEGMTLITEVESEKHLKRAARAKKRDELYSIPEDRLERPCGGAGGFDDYAEWITE